MINRIDIPTFSGADLNRVEKNIKKEQKQIQINLLWHDYLELFSEYRNQAISCIKMNFLSYPNYYSNIGYREAVALSQAVYTFDSSYGIFLEISAFFINENGFICFKRNRDFFFNMDNYQAVFNQFGYFYPPPSMIEVLYKLLALNKEDLFFLQYERYKQANNAKCCVFDNPDFFFAFENNIYFDTGQEKYLLNEKNYPKVVEFNNRQKEYLHRGTLNRFDKVRQPSKKQFRYIMAMIKPYISSSDEYKAEINNKQALMLYMINYLQTRCEIFENISIINKNLYNEEAIENIVGQNGEDFLKFINELSAKNIVPESFIQYLLMLTGGNLKNIDQLAKLIARINLIKNREHIIPPKLIVLVTPNVNLIENFLSLVYGSMQNVIQNISSVCSDKEIVKNINFKMENGILNIISKNVEFSEKDLKRLSKCIRSMPITIKDVVVGSIRYVSNSQYLLIVDKQEDLNIYQNYLSNLVEIVVLQGDKVEEQYYEKSDLKKLRRNKIPDYVSVTNFPFLNRANVDWIDSVFAMYGLLLLYVDSKKNSVQPEHILSNEIIVEQFISECCIQSGQLDCYADELYSAYKKYFSYYYKVEPIKRTQMVNIIKLNNQYRYHRLRHSASDNKWGFTGLTINKEKIKKYNSTAIDQEHKVEKIREYCRGINKKVTTLFVKGERVF